MHCGDSSGGSGEHCREVVSSVVTVAVAVITVVSTAVAVAVAIMSTAVTVPSHWLVSDSAVCHWHYASQ